MPLNIKAKKFEMISNEFEKNNIQSIINSHPISKINPLILKKTSKERLILAERRSKIENKEFTKRVKSFKEL